MNGGYYKRVDYACSDEEAAQRIISGEKELYSLIVSRYESKLMRYGRKFLSSSEDIEDIVQDVFLRAYENLRSFDAAQRFSPWIYRIAHNAFVNVLRKRSRTPLVFVDFDTFLSHPAYEDPAEKERDGEELKQMMEKGLAKLQEKYREVLVLHYFEELSYKEIADVLQVPQGTVGIRLSRAKAALRKEFDTQRHD